MVTKVPTSLPPVIKANDELIFSTLMQSDQTDSKLAAGLWECYTRGYYRVFGCRNLSEYLKQRWAGTELGAVAEIKSRSIQRLLREYRLAREIPIFRENFDLISRSARRLIAQFLTPDNADEWVEAALTLSTKDLMNRVKQLPPDEAQKRQRLYLSLYPGTRALWERAKDAARRAVEEEGSDPEMLTDTMCFEFMCNEFLATYGEKVQLLSVNPNGNTPLG